MSLSQKQCPTCKATFPENYHLCPHDGSELEAERKQIAVGSVVRGKYEVLEVLGYGGMATVYKVRHRAFQEIAALKLVNEELLADPDFVKRFRNEAVVARQLKHPNAVRIDDFDSTDDERPYIVMEYVEGKTLFDARTEKPGPWTAAVSLPIVAQVAAALEAAHKLGIVHRDIKPSNILLTKDTDEVKGLVKVLDFGIAKTSDKAFAGMTSVVTQESFIIGTPEYMSPEQASGLPDSRVDGRADLYSLGMVLYEMMVGAHPFVADTPMAMLVHQLHTTPSRAIELQGGIPASVSALIEKALQKRPDSRFQTATEMLAALRDVDGWWKSNGGPTTVAPKEVSPQPITAPKASPSVPEMPVSTVLPAQYMTPPPTPAPMPTPLPSRPPDNWPQWSPQGPPTPGPMTPPPQHGLMQQPPSYPPVSNPPTWQGYSPAMQQQYGQRQPPAKKRGKTVLLIVLGILSIPVLVVVVIFLVAFFKALAK